eukprot:tig00000944_g5932.t1
MSVAATQETLGKIIKKPKLTDNLLSKPPFRFLHDIVSEVTRVTGFAEGLYTADELDSQNIKDKDAKVNYLNKIIDCVGIALGQNVPAKPLKIVAGLEPEATNSFLQMLAQACQLSADVSRNCVQRVLGGEHMPAAGAAPAAAPAPAPKAAPSKSPPPEPAAPAPARQSPSPHPAAEPPAPAARSTPPADEQPAAPPRASSLPKSSSKKEPPPNIDDQPVAAAKSAPTRPSQRKEPINIDEQPVPAAGGVAKRAPSKKPAPSDDDLAAEKPAAPEPPAAAEADAAEVTRKPRNMERPTTARRAPPKLPTNVVPAEQTKPAAKAADPAKAAGAAAPAVAAGVIVEGQGKDDDDDDGIVIAAVAPITAGLSTTGGAEQERGQLAQKLYEANKQLVETKKEEKGDGGIVLRKARGKDDRAAYGNEVQKLRESIQALTQNINPLGKCMDYVSEDFDNMSKELEQWKQMRTRMAARYEEEVKTTEQELGPLTAALKEVDLQIKEQQHKIASMKGQILRNDATIQKLIQTVVSSSH